MKFSVKAHIAEVTKGLTELEREVVPRVTQQAINRAGNTVRSRTQRELVKVMKLRTKGALTGIVVFHKAQKGNLEGTVTTSDRKGIGAEESRNTLVRVTTRGTGKGGKRKVNKVIFKGSTLDGAFRIEQIGGLKGGIFKRGEGRYSTGTRKVSRVFAYPPTQELIHAKIDEVQEKIGMERFEIEFDRALSHALTKLRF